MNQTKSIEEIINRMVNDQNFRINLCRESLYWFSQYYFSQPDYAPTPEFHREIFSDFQNLKDQTYVLAAGRGMGKSSLALYYILWLVLCRGEKFILMLSKTDRQVSQILENAQDELDENERLVKDFGPIKRTSDKWGRAGLEIGNYQAKIIAASMEQPVRGMRYRRHRVGVMVLDDIEDSSSVKSSEARDKLLEWYQRDLVPMGDENTRIVILGGLLHPNSFVACMRKFIEEKKLPGIYREYPFLGKDGKCLWPERYPTQEAIDKIRLKAGSDIAWRQEYLLQIVTAEDQIIPFEWLEGQNYEELPSDESLVRTVISVDPASSKKKNTSNTAIVVISEYKINGKRKFYIHPNPVNEKLSGMEIEDKVENLYRLHSKANGPVEILMETTSNNYLSERLKKAGLKTKECHPKGDKGERLSMSGSPVQAEMVSFHKTQNEELKLQITGFGHEKDDLVDAFSQGINELVTLEPIKEVGVMAVEIKQNRRRSDFWMDEYDRSVVRFVGWD